MANINEVLRVASDGGILLVSARVVSEEVAGDDEIISYWR
jgi:hypothetical protein